MGGLKSNKLLGNILLIIGVIISIFPFYWALVSASHESGKVFSKPPTLFFGDKFFNNLVNLNESIGIFRVLGNSLLIVTIYTLAALAVCTMAGYAFCKFKFKGRSFFFALFMISMMVPFHALVIPLFKLMAQLEWLNRYEAIILPNLAYPFAIFLMRQNLFAVPDQMLEAGRIDGVSEWGLFTKIVLPSIKPALAAVSIFLFMYQWNNFLWPLIAVQTKDMYTLPVALSSLFGLSRIDYGQVMVGVVLATGPIIVFFLALQKHFIAGVLGSAVK